MWKELSHRELGLCKQAISYTLLRVRVYSERLVYTCLMASQRDGGHGIINRFANWGRSTELEVKPVWENLIV